MVVHIWTTHRSPQQWQRRRRKLHWLGTELYFVTEHRHAAQFSSLAHAKAVARQFVRASPDTPIYGH
ncbi:MAG TPA: hypothetical protein VHJ19_06620 [Gammaproteobacteria bacterium]|nr:hypothetical protein [Gammaproteobacteria bacterium]